MKRKDQILLTSLILALIAIIALVIDPPKAEAAKFSSFKPVRTYSAPKVVRYKTPAKVTTYKAPTPKVSPAVKQQPTKVIVNKTVVNKTTVVNRNVTQPRTIGGVPQQPSFLSNMASSAAGTAAGMFIFNWLSSPSEQPQEQPQEQPIEQQPVQ